MSKDLDIKKRIEELLKTEKHWKVSVLGKKLLCPYDGKIMAIMSENINDIIEDIYKHLTTECTTWKNFETEYIQLEKLKLEAFKLGLVSNLRHNLVYQLKDENNNWFCPFSAKFSGIVIRDDEPLTKSKIAEILDFILKQPEFDEFNMQPRDIKFLQAKLNFLTHPSFRIRSNKGKLVNPYNGQDFDIEIGEDYNPDEETWGKVFEFLKTMPSFDKKEYKLKSATELTQNVQLGELSAKVAEYAKLKFTEDKAWHQFTPYKTWVCPFCGLSVGNVKEVTDNEVILNLNSKAISKHLLYICEPVKDKLKDIPIENLDEILSKYPRHEDPIPNTLDAQEPLPANTITPPPVNQDNNSESNEAEGVVLQRPLLVQTQEVSLDPVELRRHTTKSLVFQPPAKDPEIQNAHNSLINNVNSQLTSIMSNREFDRGQDEHKRMLEELREKQMRILPEPPDIEGIEISVIYQPCNIVGGDFYDFLNLKNGKLGIIQGDVSGHGAEVFGDVTMTMKTLRIYGKQSESPQEMLINANEDLVPDLTSKTFVSIFYAILDVETFELVMARAGHNPLIIYNPERDDPVLVIEPQGMVLGMVAGTMFDNSIKQASAQLYSGDMLLFYTDGITETMNPEGEEYGFDNLKELVVKHGKGDADTLNRQIMSEMEAFRQGKLADDDITLIAIKIL